MMNILNALFGRKSATTDAWPLVQPIDRAPAATVDEAMARRVPLEEFDWSRLACVPTARGKGWAVFVANDGSWTDASVWDDRPGGMVTRNQLHGLGLLSDEGEAARRETEDRDYRLLRIKHLHDEARALGYVVVPSVFDIPE